jgi:hypothetical protein
MAVVNSEQLEIIKKLAKLFLANGVRNIDLFLATNNSDEISDALGVYAAINPACNEERSIADKLCAILALYMQAFNYEIHKPDLFLVSDKSNPSVISNAAIDAELALNKILDESANAKAKAKAKAKATHRYVYLLIHLRRFSHVMHKLLADKFAVDDISIITNNLYKIKCDIKKLVTLGLSQDCTYLSAFVKVYTSMCNELTVYNATLIAGYAFKHENDMLAELVNGCMVVADEYYSPNGEYAGFEWLTATEANCLEFSILYAKFMSIWASTSYTSILDVVADLQATSDQACAIPLDPETLERTRLEEFTIRVTGDALLKLESISQIKNVLDSISLVESRTNLIRHIARWVLVGSYADDYDPSDTDSNTKKSPEPSSDSTETDSQLSEDSNDLKGDVEAIISKAFNKLVSKPLRKNVDSPQTSAIKERIKYLSLCSQCFTVYDLKVLLAGLTNWQLNLTGKNLAMVMNCKLQLEKSFVYKLSADRLAEYYDFVSWQSERLEIKSGFRIIKEVLAGDLEEALFSKSNGAKIFNQAQNSEDIDRAIIFNHDRALRAYIAEQLDLLRPSWWPNTSFTPIYNIYTYPNPRASYPATPSDVFQTLFIKADSCSKLDPALSDTGSVADEINSYLEVADYDSEKDNDPVYGRRPATPFMGNM